MNENTMEIDIGHLLRIIIKGKWIIISITLVAIICSAIITFGFTKSVYSSRVTFVVVKQEETEVYKNKYTDSDIMMFQRLIKTYVEILKSNNVVEKTANTLKKCTKGEIMGSMSASPRSDTQILELKVKRYVPGESVFIANELAKNFIEDANKILPAAEVKILDKAQASDEVVSSKKKLNIVIGFFLGLMISVGIVFLLEYLDSKIRTEEQVEAYLDAQVLISIPEYHK